jgi:hypothetical protein
MSTKDKANGSWMREIAVILAIVIAVVCAVAGFSFLSSTFLTEEQNDNAVILLGVGFVLSAGAFGLFCSIGKWEAFFASVFILVLLLLSATAFAAIPSATSALGYVSSKMLGILSGATAVIFLCIIAGAYHQKKNTGSE